MAGLWRGSPLRSRTTPRLATATRVMSMEMARMDGSASPCRWNGTGSTCHCRSGAASEGMVRVNPPASAMLDVSGPECRYLQRPSWDGPACSQRPVARGVCHMAVTTGWSERLAPTPGLSATTRIPCSISCSAGPDAGQQQQVRAADGCLPTG